MTLRFIAHLLSSQARKTVRLMNHGKESKVMQITNDYQAQKGVDWQFTTADARIRLKRLYPQIQT